MAFRKQADTGDSLKTVALRFLADGKSELGRDVRAQSSTRASEPETTMWTSPAPEIDKFHRKFPKITRALVLAQPETTSSDEDADDGSAEVGTIETSEDARRVLKHARYVSALDVDTAKEDTSEDDAASASGGDSTPAASPARHPAPSAKSNADGTPRNRRTRNRRARFRPSSLDRRSRTYASPSTRSRFRDRRTNPIQWR